MLMTESKLKLKPLIRVFCPTCKELMVKFYPVSTLGLQEAMPIPNCINCMNTVLSKSSLKT